MSKIKTIALYFFILINSFMFCQNVKTEIININKAYFSNTFFAVDIDVKCYKSNSQAALYTNKSSVYKFPGKYLYKNEQSESMANKDYKINIDHKKKIMIVSKITHKAPYSKHPDVSSFEKKDVQLEFDSILSSYKKVELKKVNEQLNSIYFEFKDGDYSKALIEYNKTNYHVSKMEFIVKQTDTKTKLINEYKYIILQNYLSDSQLKKNVFSEENYFTIKNKEIIGLNKYSDYQIVNYLNR